MFLINRDRWTVYKSTAARTRQTLTVVEGKRSWTSQSRTIEKRNVKHNWARATDQTDNESEQAIMKYERVYYKETRWWWAEEGGGGPGFVGVGELWLITAAEQL